MTTDDISLRGSLAEALASAVVGVDGERAAGADTEDGL